MLNKCTYSLVTRYVIAANSDLSQTNWIRIRIFSELLSLLVTLIQLLQFHLKPLFPYFYIRITINCTANLFQVCTGSSFRYLITGCTWTTALELILLTTELWHHITAMLAIYSMENERSVLSHRTIEREYDICQSHSRAPPYAFIQNILYEKIPLQSSLNLYVQYNFFCDFFIMHIFQIFWDGIMLLFYDYYTRQISYIY